MKLAPAVLLFSMILLAGCATPTPAPAAPLVVQYTPASAPWLPALMACAGTSAVSTDPRAADYLDLRTADLALRFGQPDLLAGPAFQIGSDDLLVIVNPHNQVNILTPDQVRRLFTGQVENWQEVGGSDQPVQVWVFSPEEDLQAIFVQTALQDSPVTSSARLASSPQEMLQAVAADPAALGLINRKLLSTDASTVYTVITVPVLAVTPPDPPAEVTDLLACMQK